jgi:hypothetical protein
MSAGALLRTCSNAYSKESDLSSGFELNRKNTLQATSIIEDYLFDQHLSVPKNPSFKQLRESKPSIKHIGTSIKEDNAEGNPRDD